MLLISPTGECFRKFEFHNVDLVHACLISGSPSNRSLQTWGLDTADIDRTKSRRRRSNPLPPACTFPSTILLWQHLYARSLQEAKVLLKVDCCF